MSIFNFWKEMTNTMNSTTDLMHSAHALRVRLHGQCGETDACPGSTALAG